MSKKKEMLKLLKKASWAISDLVDDSDCECDRDDPYCLRQNAIRLEQDIDAFLLGEGEKLW